MDSSKGQVRNESTPEQKAKVRSATEKDVELSVEELEERIAPRMKS